MTRVELEALIDRVRRPHNRRMVALVALFLTVFVLGLFSMPRGLNRPQRERWMLGVVGLEVVISAAGMGLALRAIKDDCYRLGVVCPMCRKHLYSHRRLLWGGEGTRRTGPCPHCQAQLIDGPHATRSSSR
jgi:hypothetical protein